MRKYTIGIIIGALITLSTQAFAAVGDSVEAVFSSFTFVVNGEEKTLDADPLVYQGSTYLPVRTVANLLGYDVTWLAGSQTIEFNNAATPTPTPMPAVEPTPTPVPSVQTTTPVPSAAGETTTTETVGVSPTPSPTPVPTATPDASVTPSPTPTPAPSTTPTATPTATPSPTPTPTPEPTTDPAVCQAIRDDYEAQIVYVKYYSGLHTGPRNQKVLELEYERDQKLAAEGCQ